MRENPVSPDPVTNLLFTITSRLSALVLWLLIGWSHLALAVAVLYCLWLAEATAADLSLWIQWLFQTRPAAVLGVLGVSTLGLIAGYARLMRWVHKQSHRGWLYEYLTKPKSP